MLCLVTIQKPACQLHAVFSQFLSGEETYCWFSKNKFQVGSTIAANTPSKGSLLAVAKHKGIKNGGVGASGGGRGGGVVVLKSTDLGEAGRVAALKNRIKVDHKLAEYSSAYPWNSEDSSVQSEFAQGPWVKGQKLLSKEARP